MDLSAFQLFKNNASTNANARLHNTPIVQYGRVIRVIDVQTVVVETVIQTSLAIEAYTVTLLNLSSALLEINAWPKIGDTVLLLFLQRYDPRMFVQDTVINPYAIGYNKFSGVGILMSTMKGLANTITQFYEENGTPVTEIDSAAKWRSTFNDEFALTFCRAVFNSDDEALISMTFGEGRPFVQRFLSTVTKEHGFWRNSDGELIELDAAITEKYSIYAPITKDIQGKQNISIGCGLDKDDNSVETEAPVNIVLGENADITVNSKSSFAAQFKKTLDVLFEDTLTLVSKKAVTLKSDSAELVETGNTVATLGALIGEFIDLVTDLNDVVTNLDTTGSSTSHSTGPIAKPQLIALNVSLTAFKTKWGQVFK